MDPQTAGFTRRVSDDEPLDPNREPEEGTTEGCTKDPNEHDDGSQDVDSNPSFSRTPQDDLEDELEPMG